ncbi:MAG TPA: hypothetical protein VHA12_00015 [Candidatus Nanoarchaeia archaeon]|nr:hypothetical protein [Candidatus Nanoarchaeia archaeon]
MKEHYFRKTEEFDRDVHRYLFMPIEGEVTDIDRHLRFILATKDMFRYLKGTHLRSKVQIHSLPTYPDRIDYQHWIPQKGFGTRPYMITTKTTNQPLNITWIREFAKSPLYGPFGTLLGDPVRNIEINIESAFDMTREFEGLCNIFKAACNDKDWKENLSKMLARQQSAKGQNGSHNGS